MELRQWDIRIGGFDMEKEKKPIYKDRYFWLVILIIIIFCIIMYLFRIKSVGVGSAGISLKEFEEIELGMSQSKVQSIIDLEDEWDDDEVYEECCQEIGKSEKDSVYRYTYRYIGEKNGYAEITYEADYSKGDSFVLPVVSDKKQFNLK